MNIRYLFRIARPTVLLALPLSAAAYGPYTADQTVETWSITKTETIEITAATVTFTGLLDHQSGQAKLNLQLSGGATFLLSETAIVDNNVSEGDKAGIDARPIYFSGQSLTDLFDHSVNFDADHTNFDTTKSPDQQTAWVYDGMSSNYYTNTTYITRHSRNLPSIHKLSGSDGSHTHHGLINFLKPKDAAGETKWIVTDNDQVYDGGIAWNTPLTLETRTNLTFTGVNHVSAKVHFGSLYGLGVGLIKTGPGTLAINGTQAYNTGAAIEIQEGTVSFGTDPGDPTNYAHPYKTSNPCQCLQITVSSGATAQFLTGAVVYDAHEDTIVATETRNGLASLESRGSISVGSGLLTTTGDASLHSTSTLRFTHVDNATSMTVGGALTLDGALVIDSISLGTTEHVLLVAEGAMSGRFASTSLPAGMGIEYADKMVKLSVDPSGVERSRKRPGSASGMEIDHQTPRLNLHGEGTLRSPQGTVDMRGRSLRRRSAVRAITATPPVESTDRK